MTIRATVSLTVCLGKALQGAGFTHLDLASEVLHSKSRRHVLSFVMP